jgi:hypothetical protein
VKDTRSRTVVVLRYCISLTAWFLYTNEFKVFTLETAARKPLAGGRQNTLANSRFEGQGYINSFLLLLLWLQEFDLAERIEPGLILTSPRSRVATRTGCSETGLPDEDVGVNRV